MHIKVVFDRALMKYRRSVNIMRNWPGLPYCLSLRIHIEVADEVREKNIVLRKRVEEYSH